MAESAGSGELIRYELGYLITPLVTEEGVNDEVQTLRRSIEKSGGVIVNEGMAQLRDLAYSIKGQTQAYFGWIWLVAKPEQITDIGTAVAGDDKIIRHLLILIKDEKKASSAPARTSGARSAHGSVAKSSDIVDAVEIDKKIDEYVSQ